MKKLRIAILPHLGRPITRYTRASRSRVIYDLIFELAKKGHKVSLFGTQDSRTLAENIPICKTGVFLMGVTENEFYRHVSYLVQAIKKLESCQKSFDIIHNHMYPEFLPLLLDKQWKIPLVTTIHTEMTPYLVEALKLFPKANLVALSQSHKKDSRIDTVRVIYNGIDMNQFSFSSKTKDYFLFIGRIKILKQENGQLYDPKGVLTAIEVAKKTGIKLLISGSVEKKQMFEDYIKPHLSSKIKFIGKVSKEAPLSRKEVTKLYQEAVALLFPINWEEPFGLVVVEANACGTPVIGFKRGAVAELIQDGTNGFVVSNTQEMMDKINKVKSLNRKACREYIKVRFSREKMAENYEKLYYELINRLPRCPN